MDGLISKPFNPDELHQKLSDIIHYGIGKQSSRKINYKI